MFFKIFSSLKLTTGLLILIIVFSILGTLIPQNLSPQEYIKIYGPPWYRIFSLTGLIDIFHSWWFIFLLFLFGVNLLVCTVRRIKSPKTKFGLLITHLSILIILTGGIVRGIWGVRGNMLIYEGEAQDTFFTPRGMKRLEFKLYLEDFKLEWYPGQHKLFVNLKKEGIKKLLSVDVGETYPVQGSNYVLKVLRFVPDFFIDHNNNVDTRTQEPNNPALLVEINNGHSLEQRWLFSRHPLFSTPAKDDNLELRYEWAGKVKDYKSVLRVIKEGKTVLSKTIEVNHPLKFGSYTFYQVSYDAATLKSTGLEVVRDPGVPFVYTGFFLLNIGVILIFYAKRNLKQSLKEIGGGV